MKSDNIKKIIIADDNEFFREVLTGRINKEKDLQVVKCLGNGLSLYEEILKGYADIVIVDVVMPLLDGIGVLEKIQDTTLNKKPEFIFFSGLDDIELIKRTLSMGVHCYLKKPFDLDSLVQKIQLLDINGNSNANLFYEKFENIIDKLGISRKVNGYLYIKEAIFMISKSNGFINSMTKIVYPYIANKYNTTDKNVEKSIRSCIKKSYKENKKNYTYMLLSNKQPTNAELIQKISSKLIDIF